MTHVLEVIQYAREYLWATLPPPAQRTPANEYKLHGELQYRLCEGAERLLASFGEVTRKDVALMVEAWILAQEAIQPERPLEL
jgi:hypothetical protein